MAITILNPDFLGPEEDTEEESDLSVTELQKLVRAKAEAQARAEAEAETRANAERETREKEAESRGISWGMAEDATEEDDDGSERHPDMENNPFAGVAGANKMASSTLDLEDPKKTLRGWFEREGLDLEYK